MKWIISRYGHDVAYLKDYTEDYVMYDRSDTPIDDPRVKVVRNIGSDLYDKFSFIIENYDNLPDVAVYTKANLFKYISKEEFDEVKDNTTFTPLLTKDHKTYSDQAGVVCFYSEDGMYNERNDNWYLSQFHRPRYDTLRLKLMLGIADTKFVKFAPGSNYILPKENILQNPKEVYEELREMLSYDVYPPEAQVVERGLYNLWK